MILHMLEVMGFFNKCFVVNTYLLITEVRNERYKSQYTTMSLDKESKTDIGNPIVFHINLTIDFGFVVISVCEAKRTSNLYLYTSIFLLHHPRLVLSVTFRHEQVEKSLVSAGKWS